MNTFGSQLKKIRKIRKIRQVDLAKAVGVAQTTIANYEQGNRFPDEATLVKIADYFRISIDYLLGRDATLPLSGTPHGDTSYSLSAENLKLLNLLLANEERKAGKEIRNRLDRGDDVKTIYTGVMQRILYYVGMLWERGAIDVFQEHLVAQSMQRLMADLMSTVSFSGAGPVFLGFSVSGELHEIGIRMITDVFRIEGWNAVFLGTNLPFQSIVSAIEQYRPRAVGISVAAAAHLDVCRNIIQSLRAEFPDTCPWFITGGLAFNGNGALWKDTGADYFAEDAVEAGKLAGELKKHLDT